MTKQELIEKYEYELKLLRLQFGEIFKTKVYEELLDYLKQLDVPQKVTLPQFVADWIEYCKRHNFTLFGCLDPVDSFEVLVGEDFEGDARKCIVWCRSASDKVARAWLDGYEVEKEKRYTVKITKTDQYLYSRDNDFFFVTYVRPDDNPHNCHTRTELESAGFGWVFDCLGIEIEEVE